MFADPQDVFRILFNLMHNVIAIARQKVGAGDRMTNLTVLVDRSARTVTVRVADDGPGLGPPVAGTGGRDGQPLGEAEVGDQRSQETGVRSQVGLADS